MSRCPRCGATAAGDDYCLACRAPLHEPTRRARYRDRLERNQLAAALAVLVLAALGALVAIAASRGSSTDETIVATNLPARTTVRAAPPVIGTLTAPPTAPPPVTTTAHAAPPGRPTATKLIQWSIPNGYTLVLASVPRDSGRATAVQIAKRALSQGLLEVGILNSEDFAGLHPGYFVVFSGVYASNADASNHLRQARAAGYAASYALQVTR